MRTYKSKNQLSFEAFKTPFERNLDPENKWIKLADELYPGMIVQEYI